jgi:hypothetical protein
VEDRSPLVMQYKCRTRHARLFADAGPAAVRAVPWTVPPALHTLEVPRPPDVDAGMAMLGALRGPCRWHRHHHHPTPHPTNTNTPAALGEYGRGVAKQAQRAAAEEERVSRLVDASVPALLTNELARAIVTSKRCRPSLSFAPERKASPLPPLLLSGVPKP